MPKEKLTIGEKVEALVNEVEDMDLFTVLELAKEHMRAFYGKQPRKNIEAMYSESFGENENE